MIDPAITETIEIAMRNGARVAPVAPGLKVLILHGKDRARHFDEIAQAGKKLPKEIMIGHNSL